MRQYNLQWFGFVWRIPHRTAHFNTNTLGLFDKTLTFMLRLTDGVVEK